MKILVFGGNGFIGSNLVDQLVASGYQVRVFDRSIPKYHAPLTNVDYQYGSFNDMAQVSQALHGIDVVIHLISTTIPSTSNFNPADDVRNNLVDTIGLLECMKSMGIHRILYISSGGTVYGESSEILISEEHPQNPNCSYGIVKLAVEKYLLMYQKLYGFEPMILRLSNPYGPLQGGGGLQGLIGTVLSRAIKGETVEIWGDGEVVRDYIYISDLIHACVLILDTDSVGTFNIGSGKGYTINQIVHLIEEMLSIKVKIQFTEARDLDLKRVVLDISKAKRELGWFPNTNIKDGIKRHYEWLRSL